MSDGTVVVSGGGGSAVQSQIDLGMTAGATVTFTVGFLSRLSKAGIEALTIYASYVMFSKMELGAGEIRLQQALDKMQRFPTLSKVRILV
jgi:hypothetical protein